VIEENCVMSQLHNLYPSTNIWVIKSRGISLVGHVACSRDIGNVCRITSKPEGKRLIRRCKHVWCNDITMDLKEIG
jgi:hypothetical protein